MSAIFFFLLVILDFSGPGLHHCFNFEEKYAKAHVRLYPLLKGPDSFSNISMKFTYYTEKPTPHATFLSYYADISSDNEIVIGWADIAYADKLQFTRKTDIFDQRLNQFHQAEVFFEPTSMRVIVNGQETFSKQGNYHNIPSKGVWIIGQEQDSLGGGFSTDQRFIGKICDLQLWSGLQIVFDNPPSYDYEDKTTAP